MNKDDRFSFQSLKWFFQVLTTKLESVDYHQGVYWPTVKGVFQNTVILFTQLTLMLLSYFSDVSKTLIQKKP